MDDKTRLTERESKYLKLIYRKQYESSEKIKTSTIAKILNVKPATVTETLKNLGNKNILVHESYHGVKLTQLGISKAHKLLRKHRLLELLFKDKLGYNPQESCEEASKIDYHISEKLTRSICRSYNHPDTCPCDKEIYSDPNCRRN